MLRRQQRARAQRGLCPDSAASVPSRGLLSRYHSHSQQPQIVCNQVARNDHNKVTASGENPQRIPKRPLVGTSLLREADCARFPELICPLPLQAQSGRLEIRQWTGRRAAKTPEVPPMRAQRPFVPTNTNGVAGGVICLRLNIWNDEVEII
eukprot:scaffold1130_cov195-Pinguiococcus_pyrenoidosus.AAC.19